MRAVCVATALVVLGAGGCASGRSAARNVLIAVAVGTAAITVGAAVKGDSIESQLRQDVEAGSVSGRDFAARDEDGKRWNRVARGSTFVAGLSLIGLGIVWEMGFGDSAQIREPARPAAAAAPAASWSWLPRPSASP